MIHRTRKSLPVSLRSDWRKVCATSATVVGGPLAPARRSGRIGRGWPPPNTVALEVTRPRDSERKKRLRQCISTYKLPENFLMPSIHKHQVSILGESPARAIVSRRGTSMNILVTLCCPSRFCESAKESINVFDPH